MDSNKTSRNVVIVIVVILLLWWMAASGACSSNTSSNSSSSQTSASDTSNTKSSTNDTSSTASQNKEPKYEDSRWPTTDVELLAVPENNRYYNAYKYIGKRHTVVGPVVNVYQAKGSAGMPIFVDIGAAYPSADGFTFLIWADDLDDNLERMLYAVDHGNAWLEVTGYISLYEDQVQLRSSDGYFEYRWWTGVS